ncbi:anthranilate phosphoribosyltransferase [bacterium]|nr:anthranilate phosphoribosyltransferase [bacterium]
MFRPVLEKILERNDLSFEEAYNIMTYIMEGQATPAQIGGFLIGMKMKGERIEEIAGFAKAMRDKAITLEYTDELIDTCGTGGDGLGTLNISTLSAIVAAGAGVKVAKHGNRSVSSLCGSADLLEALGVKIDMPPALAKRALDECNFAFLFAPLYHPAMRHASTPRKELGVRTVFNILGPLVNPAKVKRQLIGVFSPSLTTIIANVLLHLGVERALVVSSMEGMDEISLSAPTKISEVKDGEVIEYILEPEKLGFKRYPLDALKVRDKEESVRLAERILSDVEEGPVMDAVLLNSSAALLTAGVVKDLLEGKELARFSLRSGRAMKVLESLKRISKEAQDNEHS